MKGPALEAKNEMISCLCRRAVRVWEELDDNIFPKATRSRCTVCPPRPPPTPLSLVKTEKQATNEGDTPATVESYNTAYSKVKIVCSCKTRHRQHTNNQGKPNTRPHEKKRPCANMLVMSGMFAESTHTTFYRRLAYLTPLYLGKKRRKKNSFFLRKTYLELVQRGFWGSKRVNASTHGNPFFLKLLGISIGNESYGNGG